MYLTVRLPYIYAREVEPEASLSWLALTMTPGIAARLSARLLREFGSPEGVFRASLTGLEACNLPAPAAQAIFKKQTFWRAEKEVAAIRRIGCRVVNWTEPEYPQSLLQIYDPPVLLYVRGDVSILNAPSLGIVGTRWPTIYGTQMAELMGRNLAKRGASSSKRTRIRSGRNCAQKCDSCGWASRGSFGDRCGRVLSQTE